MTFREACSFSKKLIKGTFRQSKEQRVQTAQVQIFLQTRAWLFHCIIMSSRVIYALIGIASWQKAYKQEQLDKIDNLNITLVHQTQTSVTIAIIVSFVIGILLDVLAYVYRKYANLILYYELLFMLLFAFVPHNYGDVVI